MRDAGDQNRLTTRLATLITWPRGGPLGPARPAPVISSVHVERALAERFRRHEARTPCSEVRDGAILLDTRGAVVSQVNGLTVYDQATTLRRAAASPRAPTSDARAS